MKGEMKWKGQPLLSQAWQISKLSQLDALHEGLYLYVPSNDSTDGGFGRVTNWTDCSELKGNAGPRGQEELLRPDVRVIQYYHNLSLKSRQIARHK